MHREHAILAPLVHILFPQQFKKEIMTWRLENGFPATTSGHFP